MAEGWPGRYALAAWLRLGRLGEDAAADAHEHREQRGAEAEALQHGGRVGLVDQHDDGGAQQSETDGRHTDDAAGAERDPHGRVGCDCVVHPSLTRPEHGSDKNWSDKVEDEEPHDSNAHSGAGPDPL